MSKQSKQSPRFPMSVRFTTYDDTMNGWSPFGSSSFWHSDIYDAANYVIREVGKMSERCAASLCNVRFGYCYGAPHSNECDAIA